MALKFSAAPIRNTLRPIIFDKNGLMRNSTALVGIFSLMGIVVAGINYGVGVYNDHQQEAQAPQIAEKTNTSDNMQSNAQRLAEFNGALRQFRGSNNDGQDYFIVGPHTVQSNDGASDYSFNFQTRMVTIDGAGEADRALTFDEFKQNSATEAARLAGCWAATQDKKDYPALDKYSLDEALQAEKDTVIRNRDNFREAYCKGYVRD